MPTAQCVAHLGADFYPEDAPGCVRLTLQTVAENARLFLSVGTIEPRKNIDYALDIFDRLIAVDGSLRWVIVGANGWMADATVARIQGHPGLGRQLFWFDNVTDHELNWLYGKASALVALSRFEGFGLPLVEARRAGAAVIAADTAVFREVLSQEGIYVPLDKPDLAAAVFVDFLRQRITLANPSHVVKTWRDTAQAILEHVLDGEG
jgi:glycosyltransferase involved in cell wall biosynthesis